MRWCELVLIVMRQIVNYCVSLLIFAVFAESCYTESTISLQVPGRLQSHHGASHSDIRWISTDIWKKNTFIWCCLTKGLSEKLVTLHIINMQTVFFKLVVLDIWHIQTILTLSIFTSIYNPLFYIAAASEQKHLSSKDILKGILKTIRRSNRYRRESWDETTRSRIRVTLAVPFVYRKYQQKRATFLKPM